MKKLLAILLALSMLVGVAGVSASATWYDVDDCCVYYPACSCYEPQPRPNLWRRVFDQIADIGSTLRNDVVDIFNTVMDILGTIVGFFV